MMWIMEHIISNSVLTEQKSSTRRACPADMMEPPSVNRGLMSGFGAIPKFKVMNSNDMEGDSVR